MPAVMIPAQLQSRPTRRQHSQPPNLQSDLEDEPLLPGQTRVRMVDYHEDLNFRGDTESSDDEPEPHHRLALSDKEQILTELSDSDSDARPVYALPRSNNVVNISSSDDETDGSNDVVDDEQIMEWFGDGSRKAAAHSTERKRKDEGSLIDWMLSRGLTIGGKSRTSAKSRLTAGGPARRDRKPRHRGLDIVVTGARKHGPERQTLLPFDRAPKIDTPFLVSGDRLGKHRQVEGRHRPSTNNMHLPNEVGVFGKRHVQTVFEQNPSTKAALKKRRKRNRTHTQGELYTFASAGVTVTSGRRQPPSMAIDLKDELFNQALAPRACETNMILNQSRPKQTPRPKPLSSSGGNLSSQFDLGVEMENDKIHLGRTRHMGDSTERRRDIVRVDCEVSFLPSGIAFGPNTYLGKHWLHELITLAAGASDPPEPVTCNAIDIELGPTTTIPEFLSMLPSICDRLFDFANAPRGEDHVQTCIQWEGIMRSLCVMVSWLPMIAMDEDSKVLEFGINEQLQRLMTRTEGVEDPVAADSRILTIHWFAIEILARLRCSLQRVGARPSTDTCSALAKYVMMLAKHLQDYGVRQTMQCISDNCDTLDSLSTSQRTVELWICLIHFVDNFIVDIPDCPSVTIPQPFWRIVCHTLRSEGPEASETLWRTIFSLCALSQFNIHGMTKSTCQLPASWELVALALKEINLTAVREVDQGFSEGVLDQRDKYVHFVTHRCFVLWDRWHWKLEDATVMFNHLVEIFRSRNFANLRQEKLDFPRFMLDNNPLLLSQYKRADNAFEVFLKLIVQADSRPPGDDKLDKVMPSKLKKLLSLAIPVGSVSFTKANPPEGNEISKLYNRFAALAVAIYLDSTPANVRFRLANARRYVNFKEADVNSRIACIRGMLHIALLMQYRHISLDAVLRWLGEMTEVLVDEYKEIDPGMTKANCPNVTRDRIVMCIQLLLGSVRLVIQAHHGMASTEYPDPALLEGRECIFAVSLFFLTSSIASLGISNIF